MRADSHCRPPNQTSQHVGRAFVDSMRQVQTARCEPQRRQIGQPRRSAAISSGDRHSISRLWCCCNVVELLRCGTRRYFLEQRVLLDGGKDCAAAAQAMKSAVCRINCASCVDRSFRLIIATHDSIEGSNVISASGEHPHWHERLSKTNHSVLSCLDRDCWTSSL